MGMIPFLQSPIVVAHEMDQRIRLRGRILKKRDLDPDYCEARLESIDGVQMVRVNTLAGSVVVHYDGRNDTRTCHLRPVNRPRRCWTKIQWSHTVTPRKKGFQPKS